MMRIVAACLLSYAALLAHAAPATVGLLGGASIRPLAAQLEAASPAAIRTVQGIDAVRIARPKTVLFVVNAPDGPMPPNKEAAEFMKQAGINDFAIVLTGIAELNDPELLEFIIKEVVELLANAGLPGSRVAVLLDSATIKTDPKLKVGKGITAIQEYVISH